ncbi:MAG: methyltransferase domain-containing protein [Hyphomicrobium sp.]|nr:methyltransferase domain-containing protein [Hyphomicrobium sp.]
MNTMTSAELMDRQYRFQRHIYDFTRTHYLFWRRRLIAELNPPANGTVVEVACGTGWNLLRIAKRYPSARLFGFDISRAMLKTAASATARNGVSDRIQLAQGDATTFNLDQMFGIAKADRIFISYALSMIPDWEEAVERAVEQLSPGGSLHIVDFGRMDTMAAPPRSAFLSFLAHYNVTPRRDLEVVLRSATHRHNLAMTFETAKAGYCVYAVLRKS